MYLYIFRISKPLKTDDIIREARDMYYRETGIRPEDDDDTILRSRNGKPYFKCSNIEFSVSHTADICGCLIGKKQAGLDIQQIRNVNSAGIAKRYFSAEEQKYIEDKGSPGFFDIWVRKEAFVKYEGSTIARGLSSVDTVAGGKLKNHIDGIAGTAAVINVPVDEGFRCACVLSKEEEIILKWIETI